MLRVEHLEKSFRTSAGEVHAVNDVSFTAEAGQMAAIVGPSGSGKSTLLSLLGLLDSPDSGTIDIDGKQLGQLSASERTSYRARDVGFVFQGFNLVPNLTARQNVELVLEFAGWSRDKRAKRSEEMLEMVGFKGEMMDRRPSRLSGGEQQRVAIARAFATQPPLILADEPTGSLDKGTGQKIVQLLRATASRHDATVLVVTHDERVAEQADRRFQIEDGSLSEQT